MRTSGDSSGVGRWGGARSWSAPGFRDPAAFDSDHDAGDEYGCWQRVARARSPGALLGGLSGKEASSCAPPGPGQLAAVGPRDAAHLATASPQAKEDALVFIAPLERQLGLRRTDSLSLTEGWTGPILYLRGLAVAGLFQDRLTSRRCSALVVPAQKGQGRGRFRLQMVVT